MLSRPGGWTLSELLIGLLLSCLLSVAVGRFYVDLLGQDLRLLRQRELAQTLSWLLDRLERDIRYSLPLEAGRADLLVREQCLLTRHDEGEGRSWRGYRYHTGRQTVLVRGWSQAPDLHTACDDGQGWQPLLPDHLQIVGLEMRWLSSGNGLYQLMLRGRDSRDEQSWWQGSRVVWWRAYLEAA